MKEPNGRGKAETATRNAVANWCKMRRWDEVASTLNRYGHYLLLIGQGHEVGEVRTYTLTHISRQG